MFAAAKRKFEPCGSWFLGSRNIRLKARTTDIRLQPGGLLLAGANTIDGLSFLG